MKERGNCIYIKVKAKVKSHSHVRLFATLWTVAYQAPLSMGFSRQYYWSGLPFPSPGDLPNPRSNLSLPHCRQTLYCLSHQGIYINRDLKDILVVQWLRLCTPNAGGPGSIPGQGTRSHMQELNSPHSANKTRFSQINKMKRFKRNIMKL